MASTGARPPRLPALPVLAAAVRAQWDLLAAAAGDLAAADLDRTTRLGAWTVADLLAHLARGADAVPVALAAHGPGRPEVDVAGYFARAAEPDAAAGIAGRARELARGPDADPAGALAAAAAGLAVLDGLPAGTVAHPWPGAITIGAYLATRAVEGAVHAVDLARALDRDPAGLLDRGCRDAAVRALVVVLAVRAPGRAVELRVPPVVAAQVVAGPAHTRGTPPNTVECAPIVWLELATGRLAWPAAVADGRVRASGARADLSGLLPVVR